MAVQQLGKKQAKKEKKNQKKLDKKFADDEQKNLDRIEEVMKNMEKVYETEDLPKLKRYNTTPGSPLPTAPPKDRGPGGPILEAKNGGSVEGKRLTKTVPPKKGPNSQGMRGTGIAIRGTSFKGVF